jgi:hypothetical protein
VEAVRARYVRVAQGFALQQHALGGIADILLLRVVCVLRHLYS